MFKNAIKINGTREISSGSSEENSVKSVKLTACVNDTEDLTIGSACCSVLEVSVIAKKGNLKINESDKMELFHRYADGKTYIDGTFFCTQPEQKSANVYKVIAYDSVSKLDKDLSKWLAGLDAWPYTVNTFASMVCTECGVTLYNTAPINGGYKIQKFVGEGITGRKLLKWCAEIGGSFIRARYDGQIIFDWYATYSSPITPDGSPFYYSGTLKYADYQTKKIDGVRIRMTEEDVGVEYPTTGNFSNCYDITGNYLLTATDPKTIAPVAETVYNRLKDVSYTPSKVKVEAVHTLRGLAPGSIVSITDANGKTINSYVFKIVRNGFSATLESTGNTSRESTTAVNDVSIGALNSKMFEVKKSIEGFNAKITSVKTEVDSQTEKIAEIKGTADGLSSQVTNVTQQGNDLEKRMTAVEQTADEVSIKVEKIDTEGITTSRGYAFTNDQGMKVSDPGGDVASRVDATGTYVDQVDGAGNKVKNITTSDVHGFVGENVNARTYLTVGGVARLEKYKQNRVALFVLGGGNNVRSVGN